MNNEPDWKSSEWFEAPGFTAFRDGRFIVVELNERHEAMTTSSCVGGLQSGIRHLVNHQSCEATDHKERFLTITQLGLDGYHRRVCGELSLDPASTAVMGTAANMIYAAHETAEFADFRIDAIVTGGVEGNAACAGDPSEWVETSTGWNKVAAAGTINTIVVVNQPLAPEAYVRALMTVVEGKTAALMELGISSRYSQNLATGTGTDQLCLAGPVPEGRYAYRAANPHTKLGELLGQAVRAATKNALRWQNGLEPSLTRSLVHALRRFGFSENAFLDAMRTRLSEPSMLLLEKNKNSIIFEPQTAAASYAFSSVLDRVRFGVFPAAAAREILRQQAATVAAALSARTVDWHRFWRQLDVKLDRPLDVIYDAIALGWSAKWESKD